MNTFALRALSVTATVWLSSYEDIKAHKNFKVVKTAIEQGGGKLSTKKVGDRKYVIVKSMYISPSPLERAKWKMVSFETPSPSYNVLVFEKNGIQVKLVRGEELMLYLAA